MDKFEFGISILKTIVFFLLMVQLVPLLVWVERRGSAFIQNRFGPNRVGPLGLTQLLADAVKFLFKESFRPIGSRKWMYYAAPVFALVPAAVAFNALPLSVPMNIEAFTWPEWMHWSSGMSQTFGPYMIPFQGYDLGIGIVFVLGISSLGAYSLLMAGWGSANKYSMMGAMRASAQMISYELALGLSLVGILMVYGTLHFGEMLQSQMGPLAFQFLGSKIEIPFLPNWGIFYQPLGAILFFAATFAETNRLPFDLPEAEGELVAGFHTEYGGLKMLMFYIGEYGHMLVASSLMVIFFFGGYNLPFVNPDTVRAGLLEFGQGSFSWWSHNVNEIMTALLFHIVFLAKVVFFLWVFVWVRWTLPRFRYDQLMDLGWKTMLPWALANAVVTAILIFVSKQTWG